HQWGFVTASGKVVAEPKYDAVGGENFSLGDGKSAYRLVQVDERLGLIDNTLREVLPPTLQRIRPLNDSLFAVVLPPELNVPSNHQSPITNHQFTIVNRRGERMVEGQFDDVSLFEEAGGGEICRFIKVKKGDRWGVFSGSGKELLPPVFAAVELCPDSYREGEGFFKIRLEPTDTLWGLVNSRNKILLPPKFRVVEAITENCFAALTTRQGWEAWDSSGKRILEPVWTKISPLNRHLAALQDAAGKWRIFSFHKKDTLTFSRQFAEFQALDENHIVAFNPILNWRMDSLASRTLVLLDSLAREVKTPPLRRIRVLKDSIYLGLQRRWGLLTLKDGIVLPCDYDSIGAIEDGLIFVFRNEMCGIVSEDMKPLLPPMLEQVVR
ncbi:MAG: WG repeat-containing protein, partial [Bacteroidota bacterium]